MQTHGRIRQLVQVDQRFIDRAWKDGAHRLSEACETSGGEVTADQLKMMLSRGERQLIAVLDGDERVGWIVYRFDQLPNVRALHVCELYAPGETLDEYMQQLKDYALANGCSEIRCSAKPVQARLYRQRWGFEPVYETLRVTL